MTLVKFGIPFDVAMSLEEHERFALVIMTGEIEGGKFDWDRMEWEKDDP